MIYNKRLQLQPGDQVALIAPASGQRSEDLALVDDALRLLIEWELMVVQAPLQIPHHYLASPDTHRADSLYRALTAPDIRAIFVTRGGYGCARLLSQLPALNIPSPRLLVGFSDITTLHLHFANTVNLCCMHAPNLATKQFLADSETAQTNRDTLKALLFDGMHPLLTPTPLSIPANSSTTGALKSLDAPMTGGCLSLLVTSLGTPHAINARDKVLMIEEVGESPYKIDRMLTHLKNAGAFDGVRAVVFGELANCDSAHINVHDIICEVLGNLPCPIYISPTFGHGDVNLPWIYG